MNNIEKIAVNEHYVWVDKDAEIVSWYLQANTNIICKASEPNTPKEWGNQIIAASPELNLEGVPSYVRWLATQEYKYCPKAIDEVMFRIGFESGYESAEKEKSDELLTKYQEGIRKGLELSKELFTEDDVRKAIVMSATSPTDNLMDRCDEIINRIKQSKV